MFNKFLLIYAIIAVVFSPLILCMRHHELPTGSASSQMTPSTNSIDAQATLSEMSVEDENEEDESDEDQITYAQSSDDIKDMYKQQFMEFPKKFPIKNEIENPEVTTAKPQGTTQGSCSSNSCHKRKDIEDASTETIRKHILMKLGMEHEPNRTTYPKVPEELRERMCKSINMNHEHCLGRKLTNVEYQSDDPSDTHYDDYDGDRDVITDEEEVQFLSFENRIYAFPSSEFHEFSVIVREFWWIDEWREVMNVVKKWKLNFEVKSWRTRTYF